ncbi:hypothetical protein ACS0TY_013733 [Phlomoides rotata]
MDAVVLHGSVDQSMSPYRSHLRNPRKIPFISETAGVLQPQPPFLSQSYHPYSQPPLLPLPATSLRRSATMYPPVNGNRTRDSSSSLTPKKSKKYAKREEKKSSITNHPLAPDPKELPADMFSGSAAFTISPPPSSLPLPTFSLRPRLISCKVAGIDTGATDDLRRLLRLR